MHNIINKTKGMFILSSMVVAVVMASMTSVSLANVMEFNEVNLPTKYIVKFKDTPPTPMRMSRSLQPVPQSHKSLLEEAKAREIESLGDPSMFSIEMDKQQVSKLQENRQVEYVEVDPPRYLLSETIPWGYTAVNAQLLSDENTGNRTICIIDSGYDVTHHDLSGNRVSGSDDSGTGSWKSPGTGNAHGTHVAGTIAAITNGEGVKGIMSNQNVNLHIVKVFNESGWGYSSSFVKAVQICADHGANVVNMSLGGSISSRTERDVLQSLYDDGVLLIAASGNGGNAMHSYPASYDAVMSIAAVDNKSHHAAFSQATDQVDVSAPGMAILSTVTMGEGVLADIRSSDGHYFERGVVPHNRKVLRVPENPLDPYKSDPVSGSVTAPLALCDVSSGSYDCGDMSEKICLVERIENQASGFRPEINPVKACYQAGAKAAIVFSNQDLPGLQNPFVLDEDDMYHLVSVTVDRQLGLELVEKITETVTVKTTMGENYQYYNGTSMAAPYVAGVAGLVWSYHPKCTAQQVRRALTITATDLDSQGRDNRTGYGLVNAQAAKAYLDIGCNGPDAGNKVLDNGVAKQELFGESKSSNVYTFDVPDSATKATFELSGGIGDVDIYVRFNGIPTKSAHDCSSKEEGTSEACALDVTKAGTYQVLIYGYKAYQGVTLLATHNGQDSTDTAPTYYSNEDVLDIPDQSEVGVSSKIDVERAGDAGLVSIEVDISHGYIGDLQLTLESPSGQEVVLHSKTGGALEAIKETYQKDFTGSDSQGSWKLKAVDNSSWHTGKINRWAISFDTLPSE
ncbi:S8 family serine peptidase [Vibrio hepatarius]|uniref:S8 family serine peptidase n=1 Tax=Vibrio hepatarius TaxID=171383 RepID=UPI001C08E23E|nr:S8 family serine peptidase [Vibrio hepatarius]MBU2898380.1 S8 family serine peptidase [Vibrio hepatarius]